MDIHAHQQHPILSQHDFLTVAESKKITATIHELRKYWVNRATGFLPFYTLGTASYKDAVTEDLAIYLQAAKRFNVILKHTSP